MKPKTILGIDISTSVIGACLIEVNAEGRSLVDAFAVKVSNLENQYDKAQAFKKECNRIAELRRNIDLVVVEEPLQRFSRGLSSSRTLSTLMRFNGIVSYVAQDVFAVEPSLVNVNVARKELGIFIPKGCKEGKQIVLDWISAQKEFSNYAWPQKTLRGGPRRGLTTVDVSCYDIADASVMALYGSQKLLEQ